jgi:hypothetical protein
VKVNESSRPGCIGLFGFWAVVSKTELSAHPLE